MAKFLRNVHAFNCSPLASKVGGIGVLGASLHLFKYFSAEGGGSCKIDGTNSHDENMPGKELALQQALARITGLSRKGPTTCLHNLVYRKHIPVISTGSFALDMALGAGGLPKGRIVEIYGPEASGKTTLSLHVIAEAQKQGGYCLYVDAEHALDSALAEAIGVDTKNLLLSQPKCGEQALSLVNTFIQKGAVDVIVVDSVAALVPQRELDGEKGDDNITLQARLMNQALRKLQQSLAFSETILIFINQLRTKPPKFKGLGGWTEVTCGGNALKFYAAVRLSIKRMGLIRRGDQIIGSQVQVKVVKNKLTAPLTTSESRFELEFGKGIRQDAEITKLALQHSLITKVGSYYSFNNEKFDGEDSLKRFLSRNNVAREELVMKLREKLFAPTDNETCNADSRKEIAASASTNEVVTAVGA